VSSSSADFTINICHLKTNKTIRKYTGHNHSVYGLDQIDFDTMVSGSFDGTIQIWKISTGKCVRKINVSERINSVKVLPNGFQIVCGLNTYNNSLRIYNYSTGDLIKTLDGHTNNVNSIDILNEQMVISSGDDFKVIIWDLLTYAIKYNLTEHGKYVKCVKRLSSNLAASGDSEGTIIIWNWLTGKRILTLSGHQNMLYFSSLDLFDSQTLISGSLDKTIKFWNIKNGTLIKTINVDIQVSSLVMLNTSKII
jgi:WD40 repeat protein